jgi:hypothetical protein
MLNIILTHPDYCEKMRLLITILLIVHDFLNNHIFLKSTSYFLDSNGFFFSEAQMWLFMSTLLIWILLTKKVYYVFPFYDVKFMISYFGFCLVTVATVSFYDT